MRKISLIQPYYRNPLMLFKHTLPQWEEYECVFDNVYFLLIDDCSPQSETALEVIKQFGISEGLKKRLRLYRVINDISWNQHGARNLGAKECPTEWAFFMDMDRILLRNDLKRLLKRYLDVNKHYKPRGIKMGQRLESDDKLPVNQFLTTIDNFWKTGGYDEDYCGCYGGDGPFLKALEKVAPLEILEDIRLIRYHGDIPGLDSFTSDLVRDKSYHNIAIRKKRQGLTKPVNPIRFNWERLL